MKVVVLLSGGVDSVVALYNAKQSYNVVAVSFDYGSKHNERELFYARYHCDKLGVKHQTAQLRCIDELFRSTLLKSGEAVPDIRQGDMYSTMIPFINGVMISIATGYAESIRAEAVLIAVHSGDEITSPTSRKEWVTAMGHAMRIGTRADIQLLCPLIEKRKHEIVLLGQTFGIDFSKTYSCYKGKMFHCGICGTCIDRKEAFAHAGIKDTTIYEELLNYEIV